MNSVLFIEGVNKKNPSAWEKLYASFYASLCSYTNNILQDRDHAQDIAQEVLIAVWKSDKKFSDTRELTLYLYRACYNNALIFLRNSNIRRGLLQKIQYETLDDDERFFALTIQEELIRELYLYINELPAGSRRVIELGIRGMSGPEIALELGITINTVKTQKSRALKFLREKLKDSTLFFLLLHVL